MILLPHMPQMQGTLQAMSTVSIHKHTLKSVYNQTSPDTATSRVISTELADSVLAFDIRHLKLSYL